MMGRPTKLAVVNCSDPTSFAKSLNIFFTWLTQHFNQRSSTLIIDKQSVTCTSFTESTHRVNCLPLRPQKQGAQGLLHSVRWSFHHAVSASPIFRLHPQSVEEVNNHPYPQKSTRKKNTKDYRPVDLTSVLCKYKGRTVADQQSRQTGPSPLTARRSLEDESVTLLDTVTKHLVQTQTYR